MVQSGSGAVAAHYSPSGSLCINGGNPAVGRAAITEAAKAFMTDGPFAEPTRVGKAPVTGSASSASSGGGSGATLIEESQRRFDSALYEHQLPHGVEESG